MNTIFGPTDFTGIGYGMLGDILGRKYEAAFLFLLRIKDDERIKKIYPLLVEALRTSFPFEDIKSKWNSITGQDRLWESLEEFFEKSIHSPFSDDTVLTAATLTAVAWSTSQEIPFSQTYRIFGKEYPNAGYSRRFRTWFENPVPQPPYGAKTNGSAMRVGPIGYLKLELIEILKLAKESAQVTHNSFEGILGAQIVAHAIYLVKQGFTLREMSLQLLEKYFPGESLEPEVMPLDKFQFDCLPSVRQCLAILKDQTEDFESLMRKIILYGGDTDTFGMICGSIYGASFNGSVIPARLYKKLRDNLPREIFILLC